jgi:hypothetical protein
MAAISVGNPFKSFKRPNKSFKPTLFLASSSSLLVDEVDEDDLVPTDYLCIPVKGV